MSSNDLFNKILSNAKSAGENDSINREEGDGEKVPFDPSQLLNLNPEQLEMLSKVLVINICYYCFKKITKNL